LREHEREGRDYRVRARRGRSGILVLAPHGGNIEPGSSQIAEAIAAEAHSFYALEGLKSSGNRCLHITSIDFDEPRCLDILKSSRSALAIHGCKEEGEILYLGGLDEVLRNRLEKSLQLNELPLGVRPGIHGMSPSNICNRTATGMGTQLEISLGLRRKMFHHLGRTGCRQTTPWFEAFVSAVRAALDGCRTADQS